MLLGFTRSSRKLATFVPAFIGDFGEQWLILLLTRLFFAERPPGLSNMESLTTLRPRRPVNAKRSSTLSPTERLDGQKKMLFFNSFFLFLDIF